MKILFLLGKIPPVVGGRENNAWNMALAFNRTHKVVVITNDNSQNPKGKTRKNIAGIEVYYLLDLLCKKKLSYFLYKYQAKKYIKLIKPDIIHAHIPGKISHLFRNFSIPKILTYGSGSIDLKGASVKSKIDHYRFKAPSISKYDLIITPGDRVKNNCVFFSGKNVKTIPNGLDTNVFTKGENDKKPNSCVYVGRMLDYKGVNSIIDISKQLDNYHFTFVGEGPLKDCYQNRNIEYIGLLNQNMLAKVYQKTKYFMFAGQEENFPNVGLEAMSCGCIVIAPEIGFSEYVVNGRNGFLVKDTKPESYIRIIKELENDKYKYSEIVNNAIHDAKKYSWKNITIKFETIYNEIIGK